MNSQIIYAYKLICFTTGHKLFSSTIYNCYATGSRVTEFSEREREREREREIVKEYIAIPPLSATVSPTPTTFHPPGL
jgi:hypothetical protein